MQNNEEGIDNNNNNKEEKEEEREQQHQKAKDMAVEIAKILNELERQDVEHWVKERSRPATKN
jgi:hypothetical protein